MRDRQFVSLNEEAIDVAVSKIGPGLSKYLWLQERLPEVDVSQDRTFQRRFNGFYRVRRGTEWQRVFYQIMEQSKPDGTSFEGALASLREATGRMEASFASKLVATIDPTLPVVDRYVLQNFGLRLPYPQAPRREAKIRQVYGELQARYRELLTSDMGRLICNKVAERYPDANISPLKRIDLVLWQHRD